MVKASFLGVVSFGRFAPDWGYNLYLFDHPTLAARSVNSYVQTSLRIKASFSSLRRHITYKSKMKTLPYNLRASNKLAKIKCRTKRSRNSFIPSCVMNYNKHWKGMHYILNGYWYIVFHFTICKLSIPQLFITGVSNYECKAYIPCNKKFKRYPSVIWKWSMTIYVN
jgi:hypothetical protein